MFEIPNLSIVLPELFMLLMICVVLVLGLFLGPTSHTVTHRLTQLTLIVLVTLTWSLFKTGDAVVSFSGHIIVDQFANLMKLFIYAAAFLTFMFIRAYVNEHRFPHSEFYTLSLSSILGMMIMVSGHSFLTLYLGLELMSLSLYALVALHRDDAKSAEAGMKYFVMGALASGILLYGISLLFGVTGTLDLADAATKLQLIAGEEHLTASIALVFILAGVAFKLGSAPFHMWVPDVYQGAPSAVTLFISAAPKLAAFGLLTRFVHDCLMPLEVDWQPIILIIALASIILGNLAAIVQTNIKRMLAYSAVAHSGYMLLGVLAGTTDGFSAAFYYMAAYALMSIGGFGMVTLMSRSDFEAEQIKDFRGLNKRNPWLALMMMILMFSMAGIPPTMGFFAKLSVLAALIQADMIWPAIVAMVFAVVGAYYYLRIIRVMYFSAPEDSTPVECSPSLTIAISTNGLLLLLLGIFPATIISICQSVF